MTDTETHFFPFGLGDPVPPDPSGPGFDPQPPSDAKPPDDDPSDPPRVEIG